MSKVIDLKPKDDLGHESAENRILMIALTNLVHTFKHPKFKNIDEDFDNTGMGKDFWGKYSWAIVEHNGKEFEVQLREKNTLDKMRKYYKQQNNKEKEQWQTIN
jgi:hypothetical protein